MDKHKHVYLDELNAGVLPVLECEIAIAGPYHDCCTPFGVVTSTYEEWFVRHTGGPTTTLKMDDGSDWKIHAIARIRQYDKKQDWVVSWDNACIHHTSFDDAVACCRRIFRANRDGYILHERYGVKP